MKKLWVVALSVVILSGCAFTPQTVQLHPTVTELHSAEGQGVSVAIQVIDERPSLSLGHRGGVAGAGAEITTDSDVAAIVLSQVTLGLQSNGFKALGPNAQGGAKLTVGVRLLRYSTSVGFWTGGIQIDAALEARAEKSGRNFEKMYRVEQDRRVVVVPTADENAKWINDTLGKVITKMVSDQKLLGFLAD